MGDRGARWSGPDDDVVLVERRADGVTLVTLNRPKANALSVGLLERLDAALRALGDDPPGAVVLWGGPRLFSAGADVGEFSEPGAPARVTDAFRAVTEALVALERVSVAAVNGYALGGGLELALACDFRVAAPDARLGQPEILLGIIPGGGATGRLPRLVGPARAKDLILTGRQVAADEALAMGLVDRVTGTGRALEGALELAAELAAGPLVAQAAARRLVDEALDRPVADAVRRESAAFVSVFATHDAQAGVASFLEHGPGRARFGGH